MFCLISEHLYRIEFLYFFIFYFWVNVLWLINDYIKFVCEPNRIPFFIVASNQYETVHNMIYMYIYLYDRKA